MVIDELATAGELFAEVATSDPLSAVLVLMGALLTAFASAVFGILAVGGLADWVSPS